MGGIWNFFPKFFLSNRGACGGIRSSCQGVAERALGLMNREMMPSEPPKIVAEAAAGASLTQPCVSKTRPLGRGFARASKWF